MSNKQPAYRSPWFIGWMVLLLAVLAMNITMIYFSQDEFSGLVVEDSYERGKDLHENMRKRMAEKPKWNTKAEFAGAKNFMGDLKVPASNQPVQLDFRVTDQQGAPVEPHNVTFYAYRNSDSSQDFSMAMNRVEPGHYQAQINFPLKGVWDTYITATTGADDIEHNTAQRVFAEE
ncbi:MAG: FixH family protein [Pseudomonadota bacterium]